MEDEKAPKAPKISYGSGVPSIYVEGLSQLTLGVPNTRLVMHSFAERDSNGQETRHIACELIMPTAAMVEFVQNIINQLAENKAIVIEKNKEIFALYEDLFSSVEPVNFIKGKPVTNQ